MLCPYAFGFGNFLGGRLLSFLDEAMSGDDQRLFVFVPKRKQPISCFVIECPKFPDVGAFQLLENLVVAFSLLYAMDVVGHLVSRRCGNGAKKIGRLVHQYEFENRFVHRDHK